MLINGIYKDKKGNLLSVGDYIIKEDKIAEKVKLYKLDFNKREAALVMTEIVNAAGIGITESDYDLFGDMFTIPDNCIIDEIIKLDARNPYDAYKEYLKYVSALSDKPINIRLIKKENIELYCTLKTMEAAKVEELEIDNGNGLIDYKYKITREDNCYRIEMENIDGKTKRTEVLLVSMED